MRRFEFRVLGPVEVVVDGGPLPLGPHQQRAVLAILLLELNRVVSTDRLVELLWPQKSPGKPQTAIQGHVSALRKLLAREVIETNSGGYVLRAEPESLDAVRFERLRRGGQEALAQGQAAQAARLLEDALGLWRGPALADFAYEGWAQQESGRLEELRLAAREQLLEARLALGEHAELVGELEALIADQPLRERPRAQVMLALYRCGRQAEALEAYQQTRERLVEELGIDPSQELQVLYRQILNHDPALVLAQSPVAPLHNLPAPPNRLIGRRQEIEQIEALLRREDVRLVTVTGAGGTGKTRLAQQAALELSGDFRDGVRYVALAPVADAEFVLPTIAQTLGLRETDVQPVEEMLSEYLREKHLLLLLDNFEHVLASAGAVARLAAAASMLKVFVTSRAPLRLSVEHEWPLVPLPLPDEQELDLARLAEVDSVALFVERARAVRPEFAVEEGNAHAVAEICARLDGLPLAIELAAARIKLLPAEALRERLAARLQLLTGGARDLPQRQRTLRDTIEWSYLLLDEDGRLLFDQMAVFVGGRSLDAIETICNPDGALDVLAVLSTLVDNSLLRREGGSEPRFVMLETLHEYANERLEARGEAAETKRRHLHYFRALAEAEAARLRGPEQTAAMERLALEQGNLRAALAAALGEQDQESALALAAACAYFWESHGRFFEAREWFERVLEHNDPSAAGIRAEVLFWAGRLAVLQAAWREAIALLGEAGELSRADGNAATQALALGKWGWAVHEAGDSERGLGAAEEALTLAQESDDDWIRAELLNDVACITLRTDLPRARETTELCLQIRRRLGDTINIADSLNNLGYFRVLSRAPDEARQPLEESYALASRLGDLRHVALAVGNLALVNLCTGDFQQAQAQFVECIALCEKLGDKRSALEALAGLAAIAGVGYDYARAAALSGAVAGLHHAAGDVSTPGELMIETEWLRAARDAGGHDAWDAAAAQAATMTLEQAVTLALAPLAAT